MGILSVCFLVFLIKGTLSDDDSLVHPCSKTDIRCLSESARNFLEKTSHGIKQYDIRPIDPWTVAEMELPIDIGLSVFFRNVSVTGIKQLKINDFKLNEPKRSVVLEMKDNAEVVADIEVVKGDNKVSGSFFGKGVKLVTARYTYELVPNEKGEEYFRVGPEALSCNFESAPDVRVQDDIAGMLWTDAFSAEQIQKRFLCDLVEPAYNDVIHNLRASAKIYPKTAYFTDL